MDKQADQQCVSNGRAATDEQRRASRQTSDGPVMDKQTGQQTDKRRASDGQADGATGRRVTMDDQMDEGQTSGRQPTDQ